MDHWGRYRLFAKVAGPTGVSDIVVDHPCALVGSHPQAELLVSGPDIAKRAFYVHASPSGLRIRYLEAQPPPGSPTSLLPPGQVVPLGGWNIAFRMLPLGDSSDPVFAEPEQIPILDVLRNGGIVLRRRLYSPLQIVGRDPRCDIQFRSAQVSGFHCAFYWQENRLWCIDLHSGNGTRLNRARIAIAELALGDQVQVGEFSLLFRRFSRQRTSELSTEPGELAGRTEVELLRMRDELAIQAESIARQREEIEAQWRTLTRANEEKYSDPKEVAFGYLESPESSEVPVLRNDESQETQGAYSNALPAAVEHGETISNSQTDGVQGELIRADPRTLAGSGGLLFRRRMSPDEPDRIGHFVSDRLVEIDSARHRRLLLIWGAAASVAALMIAALVAWKLLSGR